MRALVNSMKAYLARFGVRGFNPTLRQAAALNLSGPKPLRILKIKGSSKILCSW
jgi:hypothetical protein